jgi:Zn-finger nucleic acid-binding protein
MNCPIDGTELKKTEKHGIEVDFCSSCEGMWLEYDELDKLEDTEFKYDLYVRPR